MHMKCDVIQDLIPVYYDGIASEATCREMRLHLRNCPECRDYYKQYTHSMRLSRKEEQSGSDPAVVDSFASLSRRMRRRRIVSLTSQTVITAVMITTALIFIWKTIAGKKCDQ